MTTPQHDVDAWREILHRLETDVARSEVVLDRGEFATGTMPAEIADGRWTPPAGAPPLPAELLPQAQALVARLGRLEATLAAALSETMERRRSLSPRAAATHAPATPAYLDVTA
ncbi:MAG: hypothetical protein U0R80_19955 [Nocardioidaceae bacterium]